MSLMPHRFPTSRPTLLLAATLLAASWAGAPFSAGAQEPERAPRPDARVRPETRHVPQRQWEYKQLPCTITGLATRERDGLADTLNEHGKRGWELVSLLEVREVPSGPECLLATLKREVLN